MGAFLSRGAFGAVVTGSVLWMFGFPRWTTLSASILAFLGMGGLQYCKLVCKNLPRDLWMLKNLIKIMKELKRGKEEKLYVSDRFEETVKKFPNKVAIMFENRRLTFQELSDSSNQIANYLSSTDLQHGDTVALFMENCPEYVAVCLGLSKIGVTAALINSNLRHEALIHCIKIASCSGIVVTASLTEALGEVLSDLDPSVRCYYMCGESSLPQAKNLEVEIQTASTNAPPPVQGKSTDDTFCFIYTSGTTGLPKACNIKHWKFFLGSAWIQLFSGVCSDDIVYCTLPLYHTSGGELASGQMLFNGSTLVIRKNFSASNFWNDCIKYNCTVTFYIGELCRYILAQPKRPTDTQHRIRLMIGNGLRAQVWTAFTKRFQIPKIGEFYGATEGNIGLINPFNRVGACGRAFVILSFLNPMVLLKVDKETGEYVRDGRGFCVKAEFNEPGEVVGAIKPHKEYTNFVGYTDANASKKKVLENVFKTGDKYFRSGDILRKDEDGFLYFCDRTGDTFRWKGENVSTTEVEGVMANILELRDVVVYGVEVEGSEGRAGMAAIVGTRETVDLSGLAQQLFLSLPSYAVPRFIRLIPSADLTGTFKLQKVRMRNEGIDMTKVSDPLFVLDSKTKTYQPLTDEIYQQICSGEMRL